MKAEYVNVLLQGLTNLLGQFGITDAKVTGAKGKRRMTVDKDITAVIGMTGQVRGNYALCFSQETALSLVGVMMGAASYPSLDFMAKSAIGELANMAAGGAMVAFSSMGVEADISPPTIVAGRDITFIISTIETLTITIDTTAGEIELNLGLEV